MRVRLRKVGGLVRKGENLVEVDLDLLRCGKDGGDAVVEFRELVARTLRLEEGAVSRLRLVHKGIVLHNYDDRLPNFQDSDVVSYAVALDAPEEYLRERIDGGFEEQEERDLRFDIESLPSHWQRKVASYLRHRLHLSDTLLSVLFALSPTGYATVLVWFLLGRLASAYDLGAVYLLLSMVAFIFMNLGKRREGEASAYTIFNNFQALPGQLTGDQLDRQMVRGQLT
ncbi:hypothetical protein A3770_18p81960 [Chloropicon primus]|uniref:SAYSvFN domain-containing protein n=1 Tax=Chloropicon primus TaxID=1764295 RepID=A0A5B8MY46_9CHLO|nr:hypothetical protein A3770_18p81960 [Chloropicon primus]|mmetsp:Transcript_39341/g.84242  ORF Transcript_39341/g.84242 Transcript_39341/m.84242 type:complete len:227 (-) Transcript_39341:863-1543(-)|eukprot:QDZ25678.1 hypothetical protein A3770_18p81960 [Chloropicon primus]